MAAAFGLSSHRRFGLSSHRRFGLSSQLRIVPGAWTARVSRTAVRIRSGRAWRSACRG